jgi:hypothetical protein
MIRYRRNFVPGGTFFFTVTLADRRSSALVDHVDALRAAFHAGRRERPFTVDAIVNVSPNERRGIRLPAQPLRPDGAALIRATCWPALLSLIPWPSGKNLPRLIARWQNR